MTIQDRVEQLIKAGWTLDKATLTRDGEEAIVKENGDVSVDVSHPEGCSCGAPDCPEWIKTLQGE